MNNDDLLTKRTKDLFRIWNRERNKKVFDIIDMISGDCDCRLGVYDHVELLGKIKEILINGETQ